ncbi:Hsp20/alpha crystallin family protein [Deinococcus sp. Leaf326]|uniref:Hsp20/alpha crystallin family protein n=1 Tax=Deinococcus sp. Leaf326 TaxID=1736338 RepID=UPI0006FED535|nr:Hsp20/alpha crystallin family protein [Deinococcus sp. Leaf326]KQR40620.1 heat-shock protein [Deinococcus sp. Leaf326]
MNKPVLSRLQHLMTLREEVETLSRGGRWVPAADWCDAGTHLELWVDVPGVTPETLTLSEEGRDVTVSGEREPLTRLISGDRPGGSFSLTLTFPEEVLPQSGQASLASGVLTVRFEKRYPTIDVRSEAED